MFAELFTVGIAFLMFFIILFIAVHKNPFLCLRLLSKKLKQLLNNSQSGSRVNEDDKKNLK